MTPDDFAKAEEIDAQAQPLRWPPTNSMEDQSMAAENEKYKHFKTAFEKINKGGYQRVSKRRNTRKRRRNTKRRINTRRRNTKRRNIRSRRRREGRRRR